MRNWMTTSAGIATLAAAILKILGNGGSIEATDLTAVTAGIGLLAAKDFNKSHTQP